MQASNDDFNNYRTAEHSVRMCGYLETRKNMCVYIESRVSFEHIHKWTHTSRNT